MEPAEFGIYVKKNLLDPKHRKAMGEAVWLYLSLLDKITSISGGLGIVLGGSVLNYQSFCEELEISKRTCERWFAALADGGYVVIRKVPYGVVVRVTKARKIFGSVPPKMAEQVESPAKSVVSSPANSVASPAKNGGNNIDKTRDKTIYTAAQEILTHYNAVFGKSGVTTAGFEKNLEYWLSQGHTVQDVKDAIDGGRTDKFWKDILTPVNLLRRKNRNGEEVDYISALKELKPPESKVKKGLGGAILI